MEKIRRRLVDEIPFAVREELEKAMIEGANAIIASAKVRVPVKTGEVQTSIRHHGVKVGKRGNLYIAVTAGDKGTLEDGYQVARLQEFGTVKMPAHPFLLSAYRANRRIIKFRMRKAIRQGLKSVMAGAGQAGG